MSNHREVFEVQKSTFLGRAKKRIVIVELSEQESESKIVFTTPDGKARQAFNFHSILGVEQLSTGDNIERSVIFRYVSPLLESATGRGKTQRILTFLSHEKRDAFVRVIGLMSPRFVARNIDGSLATHAQASAAMATLCKYAEEALEHKRNTNSLSSLVSTDAFPRVLATSFRGTSNVGANPNFSGSISDFSKRSFHVHAEASNRDHFYVLQENIFGYMELKVLTIVNEVKILVTGTNKGDSSSTTSEFSIKDIVGIYSHVGDFAVMGLEFRKSPSHLSYTSSTDNSNMLVLTFGSAAVRDRFATRIIVLLTRVMASPLPTLQLDENWNGALPSNQFERFQSILCHKKLRVTILLGVGINTNCIYVLQVRDSAALALQNEEARALHGYSTFSSSQTPILSNTPILYHWKRPYHMSVRTLAPTKLEIIIAGDCSAEYCPHNACNATSPNSSQDANPESPNSPGCVPQGCTSQGGTHFATYQFEFASRVLTERFCAIFTTINEVSCNANLPPISSCSHTNSSAETPSSVNQVENDKEKGREEGITVPAPSSALPLSLSPSHYWNSSPPRRTFTFHLATFNVSGASPPPSPTHLTESPLQTWFPSPGSDPALPDGPDFYCVALQEIGKSREQWISALAQHAGPSYYLVAKSLQWEMIILLFSKKKWQRHISSVTTGATPTGIAVAKEVTGVQLGNKGGVGIGFCIFGQYYAVVGSHFAARANRIERRERDYREIVAKLGLKGHAADTDLLFGFDHVFWLGDLNYRVELPFDTVVQLYKEKNWDTLLLHDQLYHELRAGKVFPGFWEPKVAFPPTYRWNRKREEFSWKNAQAASYTDRILYKSRYHPFTSVRKERHRNNHKPLANKIHAYLSQATRSPVLMAHGAIVQDLEDVPNTLHVSDNVYENEHSRVECLQYSSSLHYYGSDHRPVFCTLRIHTPEPWRTLFQPPTAVWNTIYTLTRPLFFTSEDFVRMHTPAVQITNLRVQDVEGLTGPPAFSVSFHSCAFPGHGVVSIPLLPTTSIDSNLASQYEKAYEWIQIQKQDAMYLEKQKTKREKERVKRMIKQAQQAGLTVPPHDTIQPSEYQHSSSGYHTPSSPCVSNVTPPPGIQQLKRGVSSDGCWLSDESSDGRENCCDCRGTVGEDGFEYLCSNPSCYRNSCNNSIDQDLEPSTTLPSHHSEDAAANPKLASPSSVSSASRVKSPHNSLPPDRIQELIASTLTYTPTGMDLEQDKPSSTTAVRNALPPIPLVHWHPGYLRTQGILISVRSREGAGGTPYLRSLAGSTKHSSVVPHAPTNSPAPRSTKAPTSPSNTNGIGHHIGSLEPRTLFTELKNSAASTSVASFASVTSNNDEPGSPNSKKSCQSKSTFSLEPSCVSTHAQCKKFCPSSKFFETNTYDPSATAPGSAWNVRNLNDFTANQMQPFSFLTRKKKKRMCAYAFLPFSVLIDHCAALYKEVLQNRDSYKTPEDAYKAHHTNVGLPLALTASPLRVTLPLLLASQQVGTISFSICLRPLPGSGLGMSKHDASEQIPFEYALLALRKFLPKKPQPIANPAHSQLELLETASVPRPFHANDSARASARTNDNNGPTDEELERENALIEEEWLRISREHQSLSLQSSPQDTSPRDAAALPSDAANVTAGASAPVSPSYPLPPKRYAPSRVIPAPFDSLLSGASATDVNSGASYTTDSTSAVIGTKDDTFVRQDIERLPAVSLAPTGTAATSNNEVDGNAPQSFFTPRRGISSLSMPKNFSLQYLVGFLQESGENLEGAQHVLGGFRPKSARLTGEIPQISPLASSMDRVNEVEKEDGDPVESTQKFEYLDSSYNAPLVDIDSLDILETMDDSDSETDYEEEGDTSQEDFTDCVLHSKPQETSSIVADVQFPIKPEMSPPGPVEKKSPTLLSPTLKSIPLIKPPLSNKPIRPADAAKNQSGPDKGPMPFILGSKPSSRKPSQL